MSESQILDFKMKRIENQLSQIERLVTRWKKEIPEAEINYRLTMVLRAMFMLDSDTTFEFCDVRDKDKRAPFIQP